MTDSTQSPAVGLDPCGTCGYPRVWSDTRQRMWCCVYGDHATLHHPVLRVVCALDNERRKVA